jgi:hypothetical protein
MNTASLTNPLGKSPIETLNEENSKALFGLFLPHAELYDNGHKMKFHSFFRKGKGNERFTSIYKVGNQN